MTDSEDLDGREKRVKRLLGWAALLLLIAIAVAGLDVLIKNQILSQAKESQGWIDDLRQAARRAGGDTDSGSPGQPGGSGLGNVDDDGPAAPADASQDARA